MSDAAPPPGGVNVMLGPVGNSPGPDVIVSVTVTLLLIGLPLASTTVTSSHASCVPSTAESASRSPPGAHGGHQPCGGKVLWREKTCLLRFA